MLELRPYRRVDHGAVVRLLADLPTVYPGSDAWLNARLADALRGWVRVTVAAHDGIAVGVMIETPKGERRLKLSNVYVDPSARGQGVGRALFAAAQGHWREASLEEVYVTAATARDDFLMPMLLRRGFVPVAVEPDRYGPGRDEAVFSLRPDRPPAPVAVFSFRPEVVPLIHSGQKRHEFRRNRVVHTPPDTLVLAYESAPTKAVTACFRVSAVVSGPPAKLLALEADADSRKLAATFLEGAAIASALRIDSPLAFAAPVALRALTGLARPPMSYCFLR